MDVIDSINARMRVFLLIQAIGFFCWQTAGGVSAYTAPALGLAGPASFISYLGAIIWAASLLLYLSDAARAKKVLGRNVLNDDWAKHVRQKAAEAAFWILMIGVVSSMALTAFDVNGALLLKLLTGLSISSFFVASVIYDRQGDGEDD